MIKSQYVPQFVHDDSQQVNSLGRFAVGRSQ